MKPVLRSSALALLLPLAGGPPAPAGPALDVRLTVATIHAAALTTPRAAGDSEDRPYLLVSRLGPDTATAGTHFPDAAHLTIRHDQALDPQPLLTLSLQPGDSVRLLLSLLEGEEAPSPAETQAASAAALVLARPQADQAALLAPALAPVTRQGAHWLGSVALLVTNEGGTLFWRAFECLATCQVLTAPKTPELVAKSAAPLAGVVELTGSGGTYHMKLQGERAP